jgi:tetratricopeptide (TPR) repeat protein
MLFEKIRRTQKPVFLFLALVFGLGFVLLGVGSGAGGVNPLDVFGNNATGDSIDDLNGQVKDHPDDADAWLDLARAYAADGQFDPALGAYRTYIGLRPKDSDEIVTTATLYERRARETAAEAAPYQEQLQRLQAQQSAVTASGLKLSSSFSQPLVTTLQQPLQTKTSEYQTRIQADLQQAISLWKQAVEIEPSNSSWWRAMANDALTVQDYPTALDALKQYVELEPQAADKKQIEQYIKQLEPIVKAQNSGEGGTGQ